MTASNCLPIGFSTLRKRPLLAKKPPVDLTPQIAARAYELYQERVAARASRIRTGWRRSERLGAIRRDIRRLRKCPREPKSARRFPCGH